MSSKSGFLRRHLFPANQRFLKPFKITPIGWKKAGLPKKPLLFGHVNRFIVA